MPIYIYKCEKEGCGFSREYLFSMGKIIEIDCPCCQERGVQSKLVKAVTSPNVQTASKTSSSATVIVQDLPHGFKEVSYDNHRVKAQCILPRGSNGPDVFLISAHVPLEIAYAEAKQADTLIREAIENSKK